MGLISLSIPLITALVPTVADLIKAIAALRTAHPELTEEQVSQLLQQLAAGVHATNANTIAVLEGIPKG